VTVNVPGFHSMHLCIRVDTNIGGGAPISDPCPQPAVDATLTPDASDDIALGNQVWNIASLTGISNAGSIDFKLYGPNDPTCSNAPAFSETATVNGPGSYSSGDFTPTLPGLYRWTTAYSGDSNNPVNNPDSNPCNTAGESVNVTAPSAATNTGLASNNNPSIIGESVTFTATVTAVDAGTPTGTVQFIVNGNVLGSPVALNGSGQAQLTHSFATRGERNIRAVYSGDATYDGSTSRTLRQIVQRIPTETAVVVSPNPGNRGALFTLQATVVPASPFGGTPSGAVKFFIDGVAVSNWRNLAGGQASWAVRLRGAADRDVTAVYRGTAKWRPSVSPVEELIVN
jgi:hypothetical protein